MPPRRRLRPEGQVLSFAIIPDTAGVTNFAVGSSLNGLAESTGDRGTSVRSRTEVFDRVVQGGSSLQCIEARTRNGSECSVRSSQRACCGCWAATRCRAIFSASPYHAMSLKQNFCPRLATKGMGPLSAFVGWRVRETGVAPFDLACPLAVRLESGVGRHGMEGEQGGFFT